MKHRISELLSRTDVGEAGTRTLGIKVRDPISRIDISWDAYVSGAMGAQAAAVISKLELVNGVDVLFSLNGLEAQALNIYDRKVRTMNGVAQCGGAWHIFTCGIDFGRYLWDELLALDPSRFDNLQLKITFDEDAAYASSNANYLEAVAYCFDEKVISPIGFLMSKEHYSYTPAAADAHEYIQLPTDYPYRQMLIRGYLTKKDPLTVVDEARIDEDNNKRVVLDLNLVQYYARMRGVWNEIREEWFEYATPEAETNNKWFTPTVFGTIPFGHSQGNHATFRTENAMRGGWMDWRGSSGYMFYGLVSGYLPNHCIQLPFGKQDDPEDWYDVQNKGSIRLRLLSAADFSGADIAVILQQLRRY